MSKPLVIISKKILCKDEVLEVTNQRVLYWEAQKSLILSDLHIGKSAHFQKSGIPIPKDVLTTDLERLKQLILHFKAENLIIVGDLFHAEYNADLDEFKEWLLQFENLQLQLIKGNHDRLSNKIYEQFNIEVFKSELNINTLKFVHDPEEEINDYFTISGHVHPGVFIKGKGKQRIKLPCFQVTENQLILPAFSLFTGLNTRQSLKKCKNYCFTDDGIFEL
ncbi:ligase-associated DNA damage response endonuclease PdeM [Polaribacter aestuariivivens]|uniref:Ligase-associated DNA damage response endonuclease PdeM n=1 Tax=Polaribacter aestuariivivens TaxID=2304626 RepID=A0A5S3N3V2_9FLAO|nr:ligase-associated DNA damage response endonuclease PdeM [Polaribacter aestuariivivens]TMM29985.1 ligase-associated DNA damage response endonuclease PdeM [Polaribacter aestuariivivens]